jgi:ATP-dependent DNA ligase
MAKLRYSETLLAGLLALSRAGLPAGLEGVISKLANRPYVLGNRGIWVKSK